MIRIEIKNRFTGKIIFEFSKENNTIFKTVKEYIKKELAEGKLYANLSYANLSSANLSSADLSKRYIQIACIGSAKRMTTYCFDDDIVWCGCFTGTLEQFETQCKETHKNNKQYLDEYLGFINYVKFLKDGK